MSTDEENEVPENWPELLREFKRRCTGNPDASMQELFATCPPDVYEALSEPSKAIIMKFMKTHGH